MKNILIILIFLSFVGKLFAQPDSIQTDTHIFWSEDYQIQMSDFHATESQKYEKYCDSIDLCWSAYVGLFTVLDEPKRKKDRGNLFERVYFAPAFEKAPSFRLNNDSLGYLKQVLIFDMYELAARRCRRDMHLRFGENPTYGTKYIFFKNVENRNREQLSEMVDDLVRDVYIKNIPGAYESWRIKIDDFLEKNKAYKTKQSDRLRFITNAPLSKRYRKAKTVMGDLNLAN
jgi:hypothetical protein